MEKSVKEKLIKNTREIQELLKDEFIVKEKYMTKEPKQSKNKNKCPFGHKWNKDVDQHDDCTYCDKWEDCINNRT